MQRRIICVVGIILASVVAAAQAPIGRAPGTVLGIVEIPDVFFLDDEKGEYVPRAALTIYTRPDSDSQVLAVITSPQAIDEAAFSSERAGALVYGRERGFFLIRTSRGVGWLSPHNAGSFHSLETLLEERELTYLTAAWDGFMSASPGGANRTRVTSRSPDGNEARNVRVKRLRTVKAKLWVELEVITHTFCESNEPATVQARGWIRAHDATGAPTVWFHPGGC